MNKASKLYLKLFLWALATHIMLIALSILEVFIYSSLIRPGLTQVDYEAHATVSAPYVSIIIGPILIFFIALGIIKKHPERTLLIGLLLPLLYGLVDVIALIAMDTDWSKHYLVFTISYSTKMLAGYLAALRASKSIDRVGT